MKTSKIKTVHSAKPFTNAHGTTIYHTLTMENGDEINIGKKKELSVGVELTYELTGGDDGQQRFKKAKSVQKIDESKPINFYNDPEKQDSILYQCCLKIASDIFVQTKSVTDENEPSRINDFALALAQRAKHDIKLLKDA